MGIVKFYLDLNLNGDSSTTPLVPTLDARVEDYHEDNIILEINLTETQARIFQFKSYDNITDWSDDIATDLHFRYTKASNSDYEYDDNSSVNEDRPKNWPVFINHWHNWRDTKNPRLQSSANVRLDEGLANRITRSVFGHPLAYDIFDNEREIVNKCGMSINNALKQIREKIKSGYETLGRGNGSPQDTQDGIFVAPFNSDTNDNDNNIPQYLFSRILKTEPTRIKSVNLENPSLLNSSYGNVNCFTNNQAYNDWVNVPLCHGDQILINLTASVTFNNPLDNNNQIVVNTNMNQGNPSLQPTSNEANKQSIIRINIVKNDPTDTANHSKISDFDYKDVANNFNGHTSSTYYKEGDSSYVGPYSSLPNDPGSNDNKIVFRTPRAAQQYTDENSSNNGTTTTAIEITGSQYYVPNNYSKAHFSAHEDLDNIGALDEEKPSFSILSFQGTAADNAYINNGVSNNNQTALVTNTTGPVNFEITFNEPLMLDTDFSEILYVENQSTSMDGLLGGYNQSDYSTSAEGVAALINLSHSAIISEERIRTLNNDNGYTGFTLIDDNNAEWYGNISFDSTNSNIKANEVQSLSFFVRLPSSADHANEQPIFISNPGLTGVGNAVNTKSNCGVLVIDEDGDKTFFNYHGQSNHSGSAGPSSFKVVINRVEAETFSMDNYLRRGDDAHNSKWSNTDEFMWNAPAWVRTQEKNYHVYIEFNNPDQINDFQFFNGNKGYHHYSPRNPTIDKLFFFNRPLNPSEVESLAGGTIPSSAGNGDQYSKLSDELGGAGTIRSVSYSNGGITWNGVLEPIQNINILDQTIHIRNFQDLAGNTGDDIQSTAKITVDTESPYGSVSLVGYDNSNYVALSLRNGDPTMSLYNESNRTGQNYIEYSLYNVELGATLLFKLQKIENGSPTSTWNLNTTNQSSSSASIYLSDTIVFAEEGTLATKAISQIIDDEGDNVEWKLSMEASDKHGNELINTDDFKFLTDFTAPLITSTFITDVLTNHVISGSTTYYLNTLKDDNYSFNVTLSDNPNNEFDFNNCKIEILQGNTVRLAQSIGSLQTTMSNTTHLGNLSALTGGNNYKYKETITDKAGNEIVTEQAFYYDTTLPIISDIELVDYVGLESKTIKVTFNKNIKGTVSQGDWSIIEGDDTHTIVSVSHTPGTNIITLTASDYFSTDSTLQYDDSNQNITDFAGNPLASTSNTVHVNFFKMDDATLNDLTHEFTLHTDGVHEIDSNDNQLGHKIRLYYDTQDNLSYSDLVNTPFTIANDKKSIVFQLQSTIEGNDITSRNIKRIGIDFKNNFNSAVTGTGNIEKATGINSGDVLQDVVLVDITDKTSPEVIVSLKNLQGQDIADNSTLSDYELYIHVVVKDASPITFTKGLINIVASANGGVTLDHSFVGDIEILEQYTGTNNNTPNHYRIKFLPGNDRYDKEVQYQISVNAGAFSDGINNNTQSNTITFTSNKITAEVNITATDSLSNPINSHTYTNDSSLNILFNITYGNSHAPTLEAAGVEELIEGQISVSNGTLTDFVKLSSGSYQATLLPSNTDGSQETRVVVPTIADGDNYGNSRQGDMYSWYCDQVRPSTTIDLGTNVTPYVENETKIINQHQSIDVIITSNEHLETALVISDFTVSAGTTITELVNISNPGENNNNYTMTIDTPIADNQEQTITISLNHEQVVDKAGNIAEASNVPSFDFKVNQIVPTVQTISSDGTAPDAHIKEGDNVVFKVQLSKDVVVTGVPKLNLNNSKSADYTSTDNDVLTFTYTVENNDDKVGLNSTDIDLNGGSIKDNYGNSANIDTTSANNSAVVQITVDTTPPPSGTVSIVGDDTTINGDSSIDLIIDGFVETKTIYVKPLGMNNPFYEFFTNINNPPTENDYTKLNIGTYSFSKGVVYEFKRHLDAAGHPFYVSDGLYQQHSNKITIVPSDPGISHTSGLLNANDSFTLKINDNFDSDSGDELYYFCTVQGHSMNNKLKIGTSLPDIQILLDNNSYTSISPSDIPKTLTIPSANLTALTNDNHTFKVVATDKAGNQTEATQSFDKDNTQPTLNVDYTTSHGDALYTSHTEPIFQVTSDKSGTLSVAGNYTLSETNYSNPNNQLDVTITDENGDPLDQALHSIAITITDEYSNTSSSITKDIHVITQVPVISSVSTSFGEKLNIQEINDNQNVIVTVAYQQHLIGAQVYFDLSGINEVTTVQSVLAYDNTNLVSTLSNNDQFNNFINDISNSQDSQFKITTRVSDKVGNNTEHITTFTVNAVEPDFQLTSTDIKSNGKAIINASSNVSGEITLSNTNLGMSVNSVNVGSDQTFEITKADNSDLDNGNYTTAVIFTDDNGNEKSIDITIDVNKVAVGIVNPTDTTIFGGDGKLSLLEKQGSYSLTVTLSNSNAHGGTAKLVTDIAGATEVTGTITNDTVVFNIPENQFPETDDANQRKVTITIPVDIYGNPEVQVDIGYYTDFVTDPPQFTLKGISWHQENYTGDWMMIKTEETAPTIYFDISYATDFQDSGGSHINILTTENLVGDVGGTLVYSGADGGGLGDAKGELSISLSALPTSISKVLDIDLYGHSGDQGIAFTSENSKGEEWPSSVITTLDQGIQGNNSVNENAFKKITYVDTTITNGDIGITFSPDQLTTNTTETTVTVNVNNSKSLVSNLVSSDFSIVGMDANYSGSISDFTTTDDYKSYSFKYTLSYNDSTDEQFVEITDSAHSDNVSPGINIAKNVKNHVRTNRDNTRQGNASDINVSNTFLADLKPLKIIDMVSNSEGNIEVRFNKRVENRTTLNNFEVNPNSNINGITGQPTMIITNVEEHPSYLNVIVLVLENKIRLGDQNIIVELKEGHNIVDLVGNSITVPKVAGNDYYFFDVNTATTGVTTSNFSAANVIVEIHQSTQWMTNGNTGFEGSSHDTYKKNSMSATIAKVNDVNTYIADVNNRAAWASEELIDWSYSGNETTTFEIELYKGDTLNFLLGGERAKAKFNHPVWQTHTGYNIAYSVHYLGGWTSGHYDSNQWRGGNIVFKHKEDGTVFYIYNHDGERGSHRYIYGPEKGKNGTEEGGTENIYGSWGNDWSQGSMINFGVATGLTDASKGNLVWRGGADGDNNAANREAYFFGDSATELSHLIKNHLPYHYVAFNMTFDTLDETFLNPESGSISQSVKDGFDRLPTEPSYPHTVTYNNTTSVSAGDIPISFTIMRDGRTTEITEITAPGSSDYAVTNDNSTLQYTGATGDIDITFTFKYKIIERRVSGTPMLYHGQEYEATHTQTFTIN